MEKDRLRWQRLIAWLAAAILVPALAACSSPAAPKPSPDDEKNLALLQQNGNLTATFFAFMSFSFSGIEVTYPAQFSVPAVPITWTGVIFDGKVKEDSPGSDLADQVHGSVSADGTWIETLTYSRQVIRKSDGALFRVTVRNVPIAKVVNGVATELGLFEKSGADVQKHVAKIEYMEGPLSGIKIVPGMTYLSTVWNNTGSEPAPHVKLALVTTYLSTIWKNTGNKPAPNLKLAFGKGKGDRSNSASGGGGM